MYQAMKELLEELKAEQRSRGQETEQGKNAGGSYDTAVVVTKNKDNGSLDSEELFASLQNKRKDSNEYNRTVNELVGRIQKGWTEILGERTQNKRGTFTMVQGACEIISRDRGTVSGSESIRKENKRTRREIEDGIESWAKENDAWLDEGAIRRNSENGDTFSSGSEARVYLSKDRRTVTKVVNPYVRKDMEIGEFCQDISLFNALFGNTAYKMTGVLRDKDGQFRIVMEQPRIEGDHVNVRQYLNDGYYEKVKEYFEAMGLQASEDKMSFYNDRVFVTDIHHDNVLFVGDEPYVIDADVKLNEKLRKEHFTNKPTFTDTVRFRKGEGGLDGGEGNAAAQGKERTMAEAGERTTGLTPREREEKEVREKRYPAVEKAAKKLNTEVTTHDSVESIDNAEVRRIATIFFPHKKQYLYGALLYCFRV